MVSKVTVYATKDCPYCSMAKAFLEKHSVPYENMDVDTDPKAAQKMLDMSGQRAGPVITVDGEVIIGFDARRLNELFGEPSSESIFDVLIVGAGPARLTAGCTVRGSFSGPSSSQKTSGVRQPSRGRLKIIWDTRWSPVKI